MPHCNGRCCRSSVTAAGCHCTCDTCDPEGEALRLLQGEVGEEAIRIGNKRRTELATALGWSPETDWNSMLEYVRAIAELVRTRGQATNAPR